MIEKLYFEVSEEKLCNSFVVNVSAGFSHIHELKVL